MPDRKQIIPEISIILPCLNEEGSIIFCLDEIKKVVREDNLNVEVIIVDNNSTDSSHQKVLDHMENFPELKIIIEKERGYGSAYLKGFAEAKGKYIFMADADGTYDFTEIPNFINKLKNGYDLIIGNRFTGNMAKTAMTWSHKYIGNPFLSFITRLFFNIKIKDIHCGSRAIRKSSFEKLKLQTTGMEFASEMIIQASKKQLRVCELPINYNVRIGKSKLNSFGDGWRHLRFILLYSPFFLFFLPGIIMFGIGTISMIMLYFGDIELFDIKLFFHPMFLSALLIIVGYQSVFFAGFAKAYAITHLGEVNNFINKVLKYISIETAGIIGIALLIIGLIIFTLIFIGWVQSGFDSINESKNSIVALTLSVIGIQTIFSAFMLSILGIKEK